MVLSQGDVLLTTIIIFASQEEDSGLELGRALEGSLH